MLPNFEIHKGDAKEVLESLSADGTVIHCVMTSPPYLLKRRYGTSDKELGQMTVSGRVKNQQAQALDYVKNLADIFDAVPLHPRGSVWVNIGDKRAKDAGLLMVPEQFALEMISRGWKLADNVVWAKIVDEEDGTTLGGCMTEPANGRLNGNGWEYLYRFVKTKKAAEAWTDTCAVRIPRENCDDVRYLPKELMKCHTSVEGRNLHNVWRINMGQTNKKHWAVYPPALCERPIAMTCPPKVNPQTLDPAERIIEMEEYDEGKGRGKRIFGKYTKIEGEYDADKSRVISGRQDSGSKYIPRKPVTKEWSGDHEICIPGVVLDPFVGTGTTGEVAIKLGRSFIGIDLYDQFVDMAKQTCSETIKYLEKEKLNPCQKMQ